MDVICEPARLHGKINAIPSKSDAHRKLICAALSNSASVMAIFPPFCEDIEATIRCLEALGARFENCMDGLHISPIDVQNKRKHAVLDCGESGSTFRFLLPIAAVLCESAKFMGAGRLPKRPIAELANAMEAHNVKFSSHQLPFSISGHLQGGVYQIPGNVSSQFLTGFLFALPLCDESSEIDVITPLQSSAYVDMTMEALRQSKIQVCSDSHMKYAINGNQKYQVNSRIIIDGDWSNGAFWLGANAIGSEIDVCGLNDDSIQGDKRISTILHDFQGNNTEMNIDMGEIPDLLPILAICAAYCNEKTQFVNAARLRLKESDRIASTSALIRALGGNTKELTDAMTVFGGGLKGGIVDACGDHRLAMTAAIAATMAEAPIKILGADCVKKSYPRFFDDYQKLGGKCSVVDVW